MLVHNYCSPPSHPLFYPFLTFLDLVFLHKIFVKTYNWSALGVFVAFGCFFGGGKGVGEGVDNDICSQSHLCNKEKYEKKSGIACYYYIYSSLQAAPHLSSLPPHGRSKRLFTLAYSMFLSCVVIMLMYHTFLNQIQYSICYTSLHDVCLSIRLRIRTLISG